MGQASCRKSIQEEDYSPGRVGVLEGRINIWFVMEREKGVMGEKGGDLSLASFRFWHGEL